MAWRRPGDKPSSEPMMVSLLTHICVTWPQWVNITIVEIRICLSNYIPWFNREWLLIHALILMPIQLISINKKGPLMIWSKMVDMISWFKMVDMISRFKMVDMISQILTVIERKSLILHGQYYTSIVSSGLPCLVIDRSHMEHSGCYLYHHHISHPSTSPLSCRPAFTS